MIETSRKRKHHRPIRSLDEGDSQLFSILQVGVGWGGTTQYKGLITRTEGLENTSMDE